MRLPLALARNELIGPIPALVKSGIFSWLSYPLISLSSIFF
jgi:hypothetical protein